MLRVGLQIHHFRHLPCGCLCCGYGVGNVRDFCVNMLFEGGDKPS